MDADVERYRLERAKRGQTSARDAAKIETAARAERERLRKLFVTRFNELRDGQPWRTFADVVGLPASSMNAWTLPDNEKSQPGMEDLRVLATHFRVTTDWLLGIEGAPKHPGQYRTDAKLEDDLAARVAREAIAKAGPMLPPRLHAKLPGLGEQLKRLVSGERMLALLVDLAAEEMRQNATAFRHRLLAMEDLAQVRDALTGPDPDCERAVAVAVRLLASPPPLPSGKIIVWPEWPSVSFTPGAGSPAPARKGSKGRKGAPIEPKPAGRTPAKGARR